MVIYWDRTALFQWLVPILIKLKNLDSLSPRRLNWKLCKNEWKHYWEKSKCPIMFFLVLREDHILIMLVSIWVRVSGTYTKLIWPLFSPRSVEKQSTVFSLKICLCSPDVAEILTNLTTVDLKKLNQSSLLEVYDFLANKGVKCYNHLISGAPTSQILSYLVNHKMFDELQSLSDKNNVTMTIYVDDVVFSSEHKISSEFRQSVLSLIKKYNYQVSRKR